MRAMQVRSLDQWLDVDRVVAAVDALAPVVATFQPDVIVGEMFMAAAGIVAAQAEIHLRWPAGLPPADRADAGASAGGRVRARLQAILAQVDAPTVNWTANGLAVGVAPSATSAIEPPVGIAASSARGTHGSRRRRATWAAYGPRPRRHGSCRRRSCRAGDGAVGADHVGDQLQPGSGLFGAAAQAADALGCLPLVVTGRTLSRAEQAWLQPRLPRSAMVMPHVDFARTLPHLAAALHHGGAGRPTRWCATVCRKPWCPMLRISSVKPKASRAREVGFHIAPAQATVDNLTQALAQLLPDRSSLPGAGPAVAA